MKKYAVLDLFAGCGGLALGFHSNKNFKINLANDIWEPAKDTYTFNFPKVPFILDDIKNLTKEKINNYFPDGVDVIIGGPPCQGFSMCGARNIDDARNTLFYEYARIVGELKPYLFIMENVKGILSMKNPENNMVIDEVKKEFSQKGYNVDFQILNSKYFGVPQARERVIIVGTRKDLNLNFEYPNQNSKTFKTVNDALIGLPNKSSIDGTLSLEKSNDYIKSINKLYNKKDSKIYNHEIPTHNEDIVYRMNFVPQGGNWQDIPEEYRVGGIHSNAYRRLKDDEPSVTIKHAYKSMIIHPNHSRCLSIREVARLQSFPDSFIFQNSKTSQYQQLANAVPPLFANALANSVSNYLNKALEYKYKFIDLFSGLGGFRIAFEKEACKCVFSSDIDKSVREIYNLNFGEYPSGDISQITSNEIPDFDILCAGFPCQPFSIAGLRKGFEDSRGTLFFEVARILKEKKPKAFLLENVKGIVNHDNGNTLDVILNTLDELGYKADFRVMNALDYGIPQNRERWYCVGFLKDLNIDFSDVFPEKKDLLFKIEDIINKDIKGYEITAIAEKNINIHLPKYLEKNKIDDTNLVIANEIRPSKCSFRSNGTSPCLTAKMGTGGNNVPVIVNYKRKFTEKECLKLMGFPDDYQIKENNFQSYKQIGNSVVVPILSELAGNITKKLDSI